MFLAKRLAPGVGGAHPLSAQIFLRFGGYPKAMNVIIDAKFDPVPSLSQETEVLVSTTAPAEAAVAVFVNSCLESAGELAYSSAELAAAGFKGSKGETLIVPGTPARVLVGVGKGVKSAAAARNAVAAFTRAAAKYSELALPMQGITNEIGSAAAAQAATEGALLARYAYEALKTKKQLVQLTSLTLMPHECCCVDGIKRGVKRGQALARAAKLARDLGNTPPRHLGAEKLADVVAAFAPKFGLEVEVYDLAKIEQLGLGGLLGVNAGSAYEPRVIKLSYAPENPKANVSLVGKGIMYDSGGISLKPSDASHCSMKMDMMGAGAVVSAMTALQDLESEVAVTGWLMCTDNMPSGTATKLGDVLTMRSGKTVEVRNTDAEGRLVLADGIALAAEQNPRPDAIVDVATLTGAALMALGEETTALFANNDELAAQLAAAGEKADETTWRLPLDLRFKESMKSSVADITNLGPRAGGAITAALFLNEFVDGIAWGHLDIAGPMETDKNKLWKSEGSTGVAARTLAEFVSAFTKPQGDITGTELE
ncbi:leucyl aminopeptidase [Canibacter zhuwentaonis]|uniref:leucyl aminopeptidase n=1 Tax=Canibacter zhuwentaonis TaxID=2837491 RepID=UPI0032B53DC5